MSISNRHNVNPFIAGKSQPMGDQRLARVGYKSTVKNPAKYASVCASVPYITELDEDQISKLSPYIVEMLQNAQDGIFRSLYESSNGLLDCVTDDDLSVDSCIAFLESESQGSRLTKEYLESWFDAQMHDNLFVVIAEKLGFSEITADNTVTIEKHVNGYRGMIASLSGGKTMFQEVQIKGLMRALEVSSVDDETGKKLSARLQGMLNRPKMEELLGL